MYSQRSVVVGGEFPALPLVRSLRVWLDSFKPVEARAGWLRAQFLVSIVVLYALREGNYLFARQAQVEGALGEIMSLDLVAEVLGLRPVSSVGESLVVLTARWRGQFLSCANERAKGKSERRLPSYCCRACHDSSRSCEGSGVGFSWGFISEIISLRFKVTVCAVWVCTRREGAALLCVSRPDSDTSMVAGVAWGEAAKVQLQSVAGLAGTRLRRDHIVRGVLDRVFKSISDFQVCILCELCGGPDIGFKLPNSSPKKFVRILWPACEQQPEGTGIEGH